jgi:hypothetical protein
VGLEDPTIDKIIDDAATEVDPPSARRSMRFRQGANTELPIWMPIEQIFLTVITAKARNHSNTPRWGSRAGTIFGWRSDPPEPNDPNSQMRILSLAGRRLAASIPTLFLILIGVFLLLQFAPGDTVDAMMAQMGGGDAATARELRNSMGSTSRSRMQLGNYLWRLVRLDLGFSAIYGKPVATVIARAAAGDDPADDRLAVALPSSSG